MKSPRTSKQVKNKNGSVSTFTKFKSNGKTKWKKSGGLSTKLCRDRKIRF